MGLPVDDWQFWVVTLAALAGLWFVVRALRPRRRKFTQLTISAAKRRRRRGARSEP
jgi:hypothetical protein